MNEQKNTRKILGYLPDIKCFQKIIPLPGNLQMNGLMDFIKNVQMYKKILTTIKLLCLWINDSSLEYSKRLQNP